MDGLIRDVAPMLPAEAPLEMPAQSFADHGEVQRTPVRRPGMAWRRVLVFGLTAAIVGFATSEMWEVLGAVRWTVSAVVMTALFAILLVPIALTFVGALVALPAMLRARVPAMPADGAPARGRTALLMPLHNEALGPIEATLAALRANLLDSGADGAFDIFILSDTRTPEHLLAEQAAVRRLQAQPGPAVHYRHRAENTGRKPGNIADWVRRFGAGYEDFLILDADSVMTAATLRHLVAVLRTAPDVALVQTVPRLHGARTVYARLQQFASQVYGPLIAAGGAWWQGTEGNYWGHNALIRTRAFAGSAGLPTLAGRRPFGGEILSHDFVEAALLRRAGWGVVTLVLPAGSLEGGPPTMMDADRRDRRWCQGNLQHLAVIGAAGLHPISRLHLLLGIASYVNSLLWLVFLVLGVIVALQASHLRPEYFPSSHVLFPQWPVVDAQRAAWVFAATLLLLVLPKLMGAVAFMASAAAPRRWPARLRLMAGVAVEVVMSALLSPVTMLSHARHVVAALSGRDAGWQPQRRVGGATTLEDAIRLGRMPLLAGLVMLALAASTSTALVAWMSPVIAALLLAPLTVWTTSRMVTVGATRTIGLLDAGGIADPAAPLEALRSPALCRPALQQAARHSHWPLPGGGPVKFRNGYD
jgi:membrane glycosyltransferase